VNQATRYEPGHLARLLGLPEPTAEQAEVIAAPLEPLAVIAGAGSGKSETMAARLVWLVANGMVRPERVLGLTFTRKAAAELGQRVRARLAGLRRAGLDVTGGDPAPAGLLEDGRLGTGPITAGGPGAGSLTDGLPGSRAHDLASRAHDLVAAPRSGFGSRAGADLASARVLGALDGRVPADLARDPAAGGPGAACWRPASRRAGRQRARPRVICSTASPSCPPTTPTPPGWSPTTRSGKPWSPRCA
jgi:hypothetical protein